MDMNAIKAHILTSASNQELHEIFAAIKTRREILSNQTRRTLSEGQKVKFTDLGTHYSGVIKKIKIKKASVEITSPYRATYIVPLNMLEAA